ncbi:acyl-CoA dehydrogenase family protein [Xanthobacter aminoxidans]|uniref:Acyl-CoA dehydrogenase family protein n=1 Tax=Xanthobacter aminoxidans TaxID=186280 RepID=A0ABW6ZR12_9HYPH
MTITAERLEGARMIRESAAGIADRGDVGRARKLRFSETGFDRQILKEMCDLGWLGLRLPESDGGSGLGMLEMCALAEELGAAIVPEPLIPAALAVRVLAEPERTAALEGRLVVLPAFQEQAADPDTAPATSVQQGRISGRKLFVPSPRGADAFVVTSRDGSFLVRSDAPGLVIEAVTMQDGSHSGTLVLKDVPVEKLPGRLEDGLDDACLATAAYLLGLADAVLERTVAYLKVRKQFGAVIGTFQALQHRCVDLKLQAVLARVSVEDAARIADTNVGIDERRAAVSRAKARASDAALLVARQAVQLHGGIGFTDECDIGLYLRKAMVLAPAFGGSAFHRARFAALTFGDGAEASPAPARTA